ncbi:MAG: glutathione S-transferase N-terminal domain-containing protein [Alphaproteobacteria bacterium]|nr:glutathione S-transferase N-terminal domain-containing protein [Alphaproteobacteria bacterium]
MYTLYYTPGACSLAVHVALREIGAQFKLENVASPKGQPKPASFLAINPRGCVPVLKIDEFVLREGAAILTHLLDTHKSPLLPASGLERARALEWLAFANSTLHPAYGRLFFLMGQLGEKAASDAIFDAAIQSVQKLWDDVEGQLSKTQYLCGSEPTIADILVTVIANWSQYFPKPIAYGPKTKALFSRIIARPAYQAAMQAEEVTYKAAA